MCTPFLRPSLEDYNTCLNEYSKVMPEAERYWLGVSLKAGRGGSALRLLGIRVTREEGMERKPLTVGVVFGSNGAHAQYFLRSEGTVMLPKSGGARREGDHS